MKNTKSTNAVNTLLSQTAASEPSRDRQSSGEMHQRAITLEEILNIKVQRYKIIPASFCPAYKVDTHNFI